MDQNIAMVTTGIVVSRGCVDGGNGVFFFPFVFSSPLFFSKEGMIDHNCSIGIGYGIIAGERKNKYEVYLPHIVGDSAAITHEGTSL